jgi:glycosyltransferase involved in cell wall biosynthesis
MTEKRQTYCIVSPVRDEEKYMRRTLDSVVNQSVKPDLWVIVDDGSTDSAAAWSRHFTRAGRSPNPIVTTS